jgi:hypothetical protein
MIQTFSRNLLRHFPTVKKAVKVSDESVVSIFIIEERMFYFEHRDTTPLLNIISYLILCMESHFKIP